MSRWRSAGFVLLFGISACSREAPSPEPGGTASGDLVLVVDPDMALLVNATWGETGADETWLEYRFEGGDWQISPAIGPGEAAILGLPAEVVVEARLASVLGDATVLGATATATTGSLPFGLPVPEVVVYDADRASPEGYAMVSVTSGNWFEGPYWLEIFDRAGRIVWYQQVEDDLFSFYPSVSRDGTHLWFEGEHIFSAEGADPHVTRQTLDRRWSVRHVLPEMGQAIAEGPDDSFFFETRGGGYASAQLNRVDAAGAISTVWDCSSWFGAELGLDGHLCLMNACNWDASRDTVLVSQFETGTVFEIDVATGLPVRQMGQLTEGDPYAFDPPESNFAYQHYPSWTADGTLIVSTHLPCVAGVGPPGSCDPVNGQEGIQVAAEYTVDDAAKTLTRIAAYQSDDRWATQWGEAYKLPNGNLVVGYGQDGAAREVSPDGAVAWEVAWAKDDFGYRMIGHLTLIGDLYALNQGHSGVGP